MKNKEYLSEKKYQKVNKILIIIGIILTLAGISLIVYGILKNQSVPSMGEEGWFEASSSAGLTIFLGAAFTMFGIAIAIIPFRRSIMAYEAQQVMPVAQEGIEKLGPSVGKVAGDIAKEINKEDK